MAALPAYRSRGFPLSTRPVLALDLGGTQIRAAAILADGRRVARISRETPSDEGPAAVVEACVTALLAARADCAPEVRDALIGVGISSPGPVDRWTGVVVEPPNLGPEFQNVALTPPIEARLGLPAFLDRDTNVAALGEQAYGAGRDCADFLYITVSTGIGGAIVTDGQILDGPDGMAGEIGHVPVSIGGPTCGCGGIGHLEAWASGVALARDAREAVAAGRSTFLEARAAERGIVELEARDVAEGEAAGDDLCHELMERARKALAVACVGLVNLFNPSRIIIGGSIAENQGDLLLDPVRREVAASAFSRPAERVRIVLAELGDDVSLAGAHPLVVARLAGPTARRGGSSTSIRSGDIARL